MTCISSWLEPQTAEVNPITKRQENVHCKLFFLTGRFNDVRVYVSVADANDNSPIFLPGRTEFDIAEDVEVGQEITTLSATDKDLGKRFDVYIFLNVFLIYLAYDLMFQYSPYKFIFTDYLVDGV